MLNKNDPLIGAVQEVMKRNQFERDAAKLVNEKFGITDRRALPRERQAEWDATFKSILSEAKITHPNQQKLDVHEPEENELTSKDFEMLRAMKKKKPVAEQMKDPNERDVTSPTSAGINRPNYAPAGTTPAYAKSTEMRVNRAEKTSLPPGTLARNMREEQIDEVLDTEDKKKSYQEKASKSFKSAFGKKDDKSAQTVSKRLEGLRRSLRKEQANPYAIGMSSVQKSTGDMPPMKKKNIKKAHDIAKSIIAARSKSDK